MLEIDAKLVSRLIRSQFPQWASLEVVPVEPGGWDNRTFHLGPDMSVRLPSETVYEPQVEKEHRWLPWLAARLPLPIPGPMGLGEPGEGYPLRWSVYGWLAGQPAKRDQVPDLCAFAYDLAGFLNALHTIDAADGPAAGEHNFYRGGSLTVYDDETRQAIRHLSRRIDDVAALAIWEQALSSSWTRPPVWVHGDVATGNLLADKGRLSAVIDFGSMGVGDPACDQVIAWTFFQSKSRKVFRSAIGLDEATWSRARGWALWKALITVVEDERKDQIKLLWARRTLEELLVG